MKKICKFYYDNFSDRLIISRKNSLDIMHGSVRILNLIFDFTTENKVANIEILDASDYLKSLNINPSILNKLTSAEFSFQSVRNGYLISIVLKAGNKIERIPYNLYLPTQKQIIVQ